MQLKRSDSEVLVGSVGYTPSGKSPDITTLADGRLLVVWTETLGRPTDDYDDVDGAIFARIFDPTGKPLGDAFQVNDWQPFTQDSPQVVAFEDVASRSAGPIARSTATTTTTTTSSSRPTIPTASRPAANRPAIW